MSSLFEALPTPAAEARRLARSHPPRKNASTVRWSPSANRSPHELRSPLRAVEGLSRALLEDYGEQLDAQGKQYLEHLRSSAQHMEALIAGLLDARQRRQRPALSDPRRLDRHRSQNRRSLANRRPATRHGDRRRGVLDRRRRFEAPRSRAREPPGQRLEVHFQTRPGPD